MINKEELNLNIQNINKVKKNLNIMEVCGTHTAAISKFGLRQVINKNINFISGPGCPVCVTPDYYIDYICDLSLNGEIIIATYGDMIRVPGSKLNNTLEKKKALGANIKIVYSSLEAVRIASLNPRKKVVFMGIGFETTTPATSVAIMEAKKRGLNNFYVLSVHKLVEPVMRVLLEDKELKIDGFLCPGHVAAIIGQEGFNFISDYNCAGTITGFSLQELIYGISTLIYNIENNNSEISNCYKNLVKKEGNTAAMNLIKEVFGVKDDYWRGIGLIKDSGFKIKENYKKFDIEEIYPIDDYIKGDNISRCQCGEVLKGKIKPYECKMFKKICTPENPIGPCMVSSEGSCAAYYKYLD